MAVTSLHGRRFGIDADTQQLVSHDIDITQPCVDATVTVGDEATNVVAITIQLKDATGADIAYVETVDVLFFGAEARTSASSVTPSTGLAIATDGAIISTVEAHKHYVCTSEADGDLAFTWTDTGAGTTYIGVRLPSGRIVMGDQAIITT